MLQETVGVLSDPEYGVAMRDSGTDIMRLASQRTRAASSELAIFTLIFVNKTKAAVISGGQG